MPVHIGSQEFAYRVAMPLETPVEQCACTHVLYIEAAGCGQDHHPSELLKRWDSQAVRVAQVCFCKSIVITCRHRVADCKQAVTMSACTL